MKSKLFTLFTLCSAISMNVQAETAASAIKDKKMTLFNSSEHSSYPYRIPAIATMSNGEIIAIADQRPCGADVGNGEVDIYAKISADNGATWNPSTTDPSHDKDSTGLRIADGWSSYGYGDAAVATGDNGKVLVMSVGAKNGSKYGSMSSDDTGYDVIRHYSSDFGRTWSKTTLTSQFKGSSSLLSSVSVGSMFFASGRMLVSQNENTPGRIYAAMLVSANYKNYYISSSHDEYNYVFYTDNFGEKWEVLGGVAVSGNPNEAKLAELPNGDILISSRAKGGRIFNIYSMSEGKWGTQQSATLASEAEECNGELLKYENVINKETGEEATILLQSMPTASSRGNVSVFYKVIDENTTYTPSTIATDWTKGIQVDDGASAYSTMTIMPNGEIGFLYEDNYVSSPPAGGYSDIVFVPLTVSEITGGAYTKTVHDPIISVASGEVEANTIVEISCLTAGATIYYTTDGTEPTSASVAYTGAITITEDVTIKAIAVKSDCNDSEVVTATYTVKSTTEEGGGETEGGDTGSEDITTPAVGSTEQWPMWVMTASDCGGVCPNSSYATLFLPYAVKLPSNVIAFYGTLNEAKTELTIYKITSGIVPKNCAVILEDMDARASITLEVVADSEAPALENTNDLKGTTGALDISGDNHDSYYVFGHGTTHFGFFLNADNTIPAGKAYLDLTTVETKARSIVITRGDAEGTTAIGTLPAVDDDASAPEYYTLQGVKVDTPTRGIYIMKHHGQTRKVVVR